MQEIKESSIENIIIDCSSDILEEVLRQAQQVGILSDKHRVIVTSLVRHINVFIVIKIVTKNKSVMHRTRSKSMRIKMHCCASSKINIKEFGNSAFRNFEKLTMSLLIAVKDFS